MSVSNGNLYRLRRACRSNEGVSDALDVAERDAMIVAAALKFEELFDIFQIDYRNDHNTRDTPRRVAKMYVDELMNGRFTEPPVITEFDNAEQFDGMIVTGPIEVRSTCAHHMMPIFGQAYIGILPAADGRIIGLSKYDRIVDYFASRLQIQEELIKQISNYLIEKTAPKGLAVRISAVHMCKTQRGVRASTSGRMISTSYHGLFNDDAALRAEFLQECLSFG